MTKPLISVVTVVYNAVDSIGGTIKNVIAQNAEVGEVEYWVIDGGSTDGTLDIIKEYSGCLQFVSGPDSGIYDAMNKGIELCSGDWIIFMNAGDMFCSENSIKNVFASKSYPGIDVVYGDCIVNYGDLKKYRKW
ncbi:glycosyltransferase [Pseudomonas [fluorescens] ATCC 17400]